MAQVTVGTVHTQQAGQAQLEAMLTRGLATSEDRATWLAARALRVTATEAAKIADGAEAARRRLIQEKLHPEQVRDISGDRYVARGNARERILGAWIAARFRGVVHNDVLYAAAENPLHAATPDVFGLVLDGLLDIPAGTFVVGDIKTSKHDLDPQLPRGHFWDTTYYGQLQWQMYCAGARVALFVWEQHDDQWPDPQPLDLEPRWCVVHYRPDMVERMVAQADLLLAELEQERTKAGLPTAAPTGDDLALDGLGLAVLSARVEEATAKARKDTAWKQLQNRLADRPSFTRAGLSRVTWSNDTVVTSEPDVEAALAAPAIVEGEPEATDITGADLKADLDRAQQVWNDHLGRFRRDVTTTKQTLTVTDPAKAKSTKGTKR
jgi:hypothetical protein